MLPRGYQPSVWPSSARKYSPVGRHPATRLGVGDAEDANYEARVAEVGELVKPGFVDGSADFADVRGYPAAKLTFTLC